MKQDNSLTPQRRAFLKGVVVAGGAGAVAAAVPGIAGAGTPAQGSTTAEPSAKGYRLTEHVQAYYRTCRQS